MHPAIQYTLDCQQTHAHLYAVQLDFIAPAVDALDLRLPAWIQGSYLIREFARHLEGLRAEGFLVRKQDKHTWRITPEDGGQFKGGEHVCVRYQVYAFDVSVRGAYLDAERGFFNPCCVCLQVLALSDSPCRLQFVLPKTLPAWQIASALPVDAQGSFVAKDYTELLDAPFELGGFYPAEFAVQGVPHRLILSGLPQQDWLAQGVDVPRLLRDIETVCAYQMQFWGDVPFTHYDFMLLITQNGYGGLEHTHSTALIASPEHLPRLNHTHQAPKYAELLGLISHEYFHAWNVKRLRPAAFTQTDYHQEHYTELLWFFEGFTAYYDDLCLLRTGLLDAQSYLDGMAKTATALQRSSGRQVQSLAESSFDAWIKFYRADENAPNSQVSYYGKGSLVAWLLDVHLRAQGQSLDGLMRRLWQAYAHQPLTEEGLEVAMARLTGLDLSAFFAAYIRGCVELPLASALQQIGVACQWRPAQNSQDKGGWVDAPKPLLALGVRWVADGAGIKMTHVLRGGAAECAGWQVGDVLLSLAGLQVGATHFDALLQGLSADQVVPFALMRRGHLVQGDITPSLAIADTCGLRVEDNKAFARWAQAV